MRLACFFLLAGQVLASEPVLLRTGGERRLPPAETARQFLTLVCSSPHLVNAPYRKGMFACPVCPRWTSFPGLADGLEVVAIHYGHFTMPDLDQALVATGGCEPHSENWGGSLLFTSHDGKWRFNRYLEGLISDNCATLDRVDGRTMLVCSREEGHQAVHTRTLYTVDLLRPKDSWEKDALVLTDTMSGCGWTAADRNLYPLQKAVFRQIAVDPETAEVSAEVEFGVRKITGAQSGRCDEFGSKHRPLPASIAPETKSYEVKFRFDGKRLLPERETAANMRIVEDQSAVPYPGKVPAAP